MANCFSKRVLAGCNKLLEYFEISRDLRNQGAIFDYKDPPAGIVNAGNVTWDFLEFVVHCMDGISSATQESKCHSNGDGQIC